MTMNIRDNGSHMLILTAVGSLLFVHYWNLTTFLKLDKTPLTIRVNWFMVVGLEWGGL